LHKRAQFLSKEGFEGIYSDIRHEDIDLGDGFTFDFELFEHRVPSVGYRVFEKSLLSADADLMLSCGYKPGKWVGELKKLVEEGYDADAMLEVQTTEGSEIVKVFELEAKFITHNKAQDLTFITDIAPSFSNYLKACDFARNTDSLLIEGVFLKEDILHAMDKKHLTLDLAKTIYKRCGAKKVRFFHFAARYDRNRGPFIKRLYDGFDGEIMELETR
jgi:ribonuclease Z